MNKLTQEELSERLEWWETRLGRTPSGLWRKDRQALTQLKEIVEKWFEYGLDQGGCSIQRLHEVLLYTLLEVLKND